MLTHEQAGSPKWPSVYLIVCLCLFSSFLCGILHLFIYYTYLFSFKCPSGIPPSPAVATVAVAAPDRTEASSEGIGSVFLY